MIRKSDGKWQPIDLILNKAPLPSVVWKDQETPRWRQTIHGRNSNARSEALLLAAVLHSTALSNCVVWAYTRQPWPWHNRDEQRSSVESAWAVKKKKRTLCNCVMCRWTSKQTLGQACVPYPWPNSCVVCCACVCPRAVQQYIQIHFIHMRCGIWSLTLSVEHRLRVFANMVHRKIFGPKTVEVTREWRRLHHGKIYDLYLLAPWSRVLLVKLTGFQLIKKFPTYYGSWRFITAFTSTRHLPLTWASSIQSIPSPPTYGRSILTLSFHLHLCLPSGLFPSGFPTKILYTPLLFPLRANVPPVSFSICYDVLLCKY